MRRFLLILIAASSALRATSITFVTCTLGTTTQTNSSSCLIGPFPVIVPPQFPVVGADASASGSADPLGGLLVASTDAFAFPLDSGLTTDAEASASDTEIFAGTGPHRLGLVTFDVSLSTTHDDPGGSAFLSDGVNNYTLPFACGFGGCEETGTLPFYLGADVKYQASVEVSAGVTECFTGCPNADIQLSFSLLAAPIPEPSTWGLVLFGLGACILLRVRARRTDLSPREASASDCLHS